MNNFVFIYLATHSSPFLDYQGTEAIQGLFLELPWLSKFGEFKKAHWNLEVFSKMSNLKLLIIHGVHLQHGPKHLSNSLRFLDWSLYPSKSLPSSFQPNELVELHMCHSKIERLWEGVKVQLLFRYSLYVCVCVINKFPFL